MSAPQRTGLSSARRSVTSHRSHRYASLFIAQLPDTGNGGGKLTVAGITAVLSLPVATLPAAFTWANQRNVERLRADLVERKLEADARRSYTYDALKRPYTEYEPIR